MTETTQPPTLPYDISAMGEAAILLTCDPPRGSNPIDLRVQEIIWQVASAAPLWPGVQQSVPGVNNLLLTFNPLATTPEALSAAIADAWAKAGTWTEPTKLLEIPVRYGGALGPDLAELETITGLPPDEIIRIHTAATYTVMAVGAMPGFAYLAGLDPRLAAPRRATPRLRVPEGSVGIGGPQTAVMTTTAPSGWNYIGHTDMRLFDLAKPRPALLQPGDQVRFTVQNTCQTL